MPPMMKEKELPKAIELSHHLSELSKARQASPLKELIKYAQRPGMLLMGAGQPSPDYFPFETLLADVQFPDSFGLSPSQHDSSSGFSWFWKLFGGTNSRKERTERISIPKYAATKEEVSLAVALQYGISAGLLPLQDFINEFTEKVYQPSYADWTTFVHAGNSDGWNKAVMTLCNPGELFLAEEWTYPSALYNAVPMPVKPVPIKIDGEGMRSDDLRKVLSEWDENARGAKRPHVMYTVPIGQNPTGATMLGARKKEIYNICVEFDIIIVEDDPYYFLQEGAYYPKAERTYEHAGKDTDEEAAYIARLAPSYLKFDYQGRVIRLDTFSKTVAPGSRLGWFTCSPLFAERLQRQSEVSTQAPCGFGQSLITTLLTKQFGYKGYIRWLRGLRTEYTMRRDYLIDCISEEFHLRSMYVTEGMWAGCTAYAGRAKRITSGNDEAPNEKMGFGEKTLISFVPPTSGMFIWIKIHFDNLPSYTPGNEDAYERQLFINLAESKLILTRGMDFAADQLPESDKDSGHFRMSFSIGDHETMKKGVGIFAKVVREFFEV